MKSLYLCVLLLAAWAAPSIAEQAKAIERIGGNFTVTKITKQGKGGGFVVEFKATEGSPKVAKLLLETDHVNAGLSEGSSVRLSADVRHLSGETADVDQVVVFLPGRSGPTPVWMLSKRANVGVPPAKLIEMHSPSTDYSVF